VGQARAYYAEKALSAAFYDTVTGADERLAGDLDIYFDLAPPGGSVLELGCGLSVLGLDIAPAMLAQASAKRADLEPSVAARVELRRGDMTAFDAKRLVDLVICPYFTLAHVPRGSAWRNTFATAARHLKSGGLAAFHLPREEIMRLPGPADPSLPVFDQPTVTGGRLQLFVRERSYREEVGRLDQVIEYVEFDAWGTVLRRSPERQTMYMADPTSISRGSGLLLDRDPIELGGVGDIWVFRKA
jgi:SAM-dependent methyltransferase